MNIQAWAIAHKTQLLVSGGGGVAALALWRKHKAGTGATVSTGASTTPATGTTGSGGYDSSANDVYNSVQGVLEQLQGTVSQLNGGGLATATPVSKSPQLIVADQIDEQNALADGIPKSWLSYAGSDPYASKANSSNGYAAPTDLSTFSGTGGVYVGLAGQGAPSGATVLAGPDRNATNQLLKAWYAATNKGTS